MKGFKNIQALQKKLLQKIKNLLGLLQNCGFVKAAGKKCGFAAHRALFSNKLDYLLFFLALVVLILGLFRFLSFGRSGGIPEGKIPVLVFTHWLSEENSGSPSNESSDFPDRNSGSVLENLVREFEESRDIRIVLDPRPYEEIRKLLLDFSDETPDGGELTNNGNPGEEKVTDSRRPGDILILDPLWIGDLFKNGVLDPESPPAEPLIRFFYPLFYNIEILKDAGFNRPPKSRGEFLAYAKAVTDPDAGRYGIAFALGRQNSLGIYQNIYPWFWAGGAFVSGGGKAFEETLDFLSALNREKTVHPASFSMDEKAKQEAFIKGRAAFMIGPVQDIKRLRREMGDDAFGFTTVPGPDSYPGKPVFGASGWSLGIFRQSKYPEEAEAFIAFLTEKSALLAEEIGAVPGGGNRPSPARTADPFYAKAWELYDAGDMVREFAWGAPPNNTGGGGTEREEIFRRELSALFEEK